MTKNWFTLILVFSSIFSLLTGCKYFREGVNDQVTVQSYPSGAEVIIEGRRIGSTPLLMELPRKITHRFSLEKSGYKDWEQELYPVLNEWGTARVRFQLAQDLGYYFDLQPNPVAVQMEPMLLPDSIGVDPYSQMSDLIMRADKMLENGEITAEEHKYMTEKIIEFFTE